MLMNFSLLGLFGVFIFLIWIIIAMITKNQKGILAIGIVISALILVTGVSITSSASASANHNKANTNSIKNINAAEKSVNYNLEKISVNNKEKNSTINSNSGKISKEKGLNIITSKVKPDINIQIIYDSKVDIKENTYYLYTLNTNGYTLEDFAYCVDIKSGKLFKCSMDMILSTIE